MKGQTMELVELLILIAGVSILISISYFLSSSKLPQTSSLLTEQHKYERVTEAVRNFLYTKIPGFDKTYGQMLGDMVVNGGESIVDYGGKYGGINVTKIIYEYFDSYFPGRWSLNLTEKTQITHILWIPNSGSGNSVSKISITDGRELSRYYTVPSNEKGDPSRVSLDKKGNVWVGNRGTRTIVKIGLAENNQCIDKNSDGKIETYKDKILPFGEDECLLVNRPLGGGPKSFNWVGVRAVCVDQQDNVYAGLYSDHKLFYISSNGDIIKEWDIYNYVQSPARPYGCFVDRNGIVWISTSEDKKLLRFDPKTETFVVVNFNHWVYSIAPCLTEDCLVITGYADKTLTKLNTTDNSIIFDKYEQDFNNARGVIVDEDENIYAVSSGKNLVFKYDKFGNELNRSSTCTEPKGIGMDILGKIWVACGDTHIWRFDKNLSWELDSKFGTDHYVYNFFTSHDVSPIVIARGISFGYAYEDSTRLITFVAPLPVPSSRGEVIYFEFKTW